MSTKFLNCILIILVFCSPILGQAQPLGKIKKSDYKKDIQIQTDSGELVLRLYEQTPLHRDNYIRLVKTGYYNGISFHRVISGFMIQAGDEKTKKDYDSSKGLKNYTIPAEFIPELYHKRGVLAAARMGDNVNPKKESSGVQFYIVQGRKFTDQSLDSVETHRLNGRKLPAEHRIDYKNLGGAPHLDQNYTIFGYLVKGYDVLDKIGNTPTSGRSGGDKPLGDIRIQQVRLIKRSKE